MVAVSLWDERWAFASHLFSESEETSFIGPPRPVFEIVGKLQTLYVDVRENNVYQALRVLKKKMQREGLLIEMRAKEFYEKPSVKKVRQAKEAIKRKRKADRIRTAKMGFWAWSEIRLHHFHESNNSLLQIRYF